MSKREAVLLAISFIIPFGLQYGVVKFEFYLMSSGLYDLAELISLVRLFTLIGILTYGTYKVLDSIF